MSKIEILEKDDHNWPPFVILQHGNQTAEFSQLGNTLPAMLEQAHKWGQREAAEELGQKEKTTSRITPLLRNIIYPKPKTTKYER